MTTTRFVEIESPPGAAGPPRAPDVDRLPDFIGAGGDIGAGSDARARLAALDVLVPGCGSVGARMVMLLARLGVGGIAIVDPKTFKRNFGTQPILPADVGAPKAVQVARRARLVAPATRIRAAVGGIQDVPWDELVGFDVICASTDNLAAEVAVGRCAAALGVPLLYASVHGPSLTAQVRVLLHRDGDGPCIGCGFGSAEWAALAADEARFSCLGSDANGGGARRADAAPPTMSVAALCSMAADLAVLQVVRRALGLGGQPLDDCILEYNAYNHSTAVSPLKPNPRCPIDHGRVRVERMGVLGEATLRQCARTAGVADGDLDRATVRVDDRVYTTQLACEACGAPRPRTGFVSAAARSTEPCPDCGRATPMMPHPLHSYEETPVTALADVLDVPLRSLGAPDAGWIEVRVDGHAALVTGDRAGATTAGTTTKENR